MDASLKSFVKQALLDITNAVNEARDESPVNIAPGYVEGALRQVGLHVDRTEIMLPGITMLTRASKPA